MGKNSKVKNRFIKIIVLLIVAVAAIALFVYCTASKRYDGETTMVYISRGDSEEAMNDSLQKSLGEDFSSAVMKLWKNLPGDAVPHSGAFKVSAGDRAIDVAKRLRNGRQTPVRITFNNVRSIDELAERIDPQMDLSAQEFCNAVDSSFASSGVKPEMTPAHFLPDTYEVYWNESGTRLVERLESHYHSFWNEERKQKAAQLGLTPDEVVTLASIVEEETNKADERGKVARLYLNRLRRGMKLQADPTVKFAVGDFSLKRILNKHLTTESPYNTYLYEGLPPGPIRIAEGRTIDAVLNAPKHDYIYMCAKSDFSGYHNFASDYATHLKNARDYQSALNARNVR